MNQIPDEPETKEDISSLYSRLGSSVMPPLPAALKQILNHLLTLTSHPTLRSIKSKSGNQIKLQIFPQNGPDQLQASIRALLSVHSQLSSYPGQKLKCREPQEFKKKVLSLLFSQVKIYISIFSMNSERRNSLIRQEVRRNWGFFCFINTGAQEETLWTDVMDEDIRFNGSTSRGETIVLAVSNTLRWVSCASDVHISSLCAILALFFLINSPLLIEL